MQAGQVDAAINDTRSCYDFAKDNPSDTAVAKEFNTGEQYGFTVQEGQRQRRELLAKHQQGAGQGQDRRQVRRDLQEVVRHRAGASVGS